MNSLQTSSFASQFIGRAPEFEPQAVKGRLVNWERLLSMMEARDLDGLVSYYSPNVYYLSNFVGNAALHEANGNGVVVMSRHQPDHPILIVVDVFLTFFHDQPTWIEDLRAHRGSAVQYEGHPIESFVPSSLRSEEWAKSAANHYATGRVEATQQALRDLGLNRDSRVGFDNLGFAGTVAMDGMEIVDAYSAMKYVRQVKTPTEVGLLRRATALNQRAIERTVADWQPGLTWHEMNRVYQAHVLDLGGFTRDPHAIAVMSPNESDLDVPMVLQSGFEEDYEIKRGDAIMFDCHGSINRYCWDGGKTWYVGSPQNNAKRIAVACNFALAELQSKMVPGSRTDELRTVAREVLRKEGLPHHNDALVFFHGVGLEHNDIEMPDGAEWKLQGVQNWGIEKDMIMAIHVAYPGSNSERYWIEDTTFVTESGGESIFTWGSDPLTNE